MINEDNWKPDLFPELKQKLLNAINVQHNPNNEKIFMEKLDEIYIM
jgi:hypothetical protein